VVQPVIAVLFLKRAAVLPAKHHCELAVFLSARISLCDLHSVILDDSRSRNSNARENLGSVRGPSNSHTSAPNLRKVRRGMAVPAFLSRFHLELITFLLASALFIAQILEHPFHGREVQVVPFFIVRSHI
jgi:hypothetical protein